MFKLSLITLTTALSFATFFSKTVQAAVLNGGFETGDYSNWTTTGQTTIEDLSFGVTPAEGTYQALLDTCAIDSVSDACDDSIGLVSATDLETFLDLNAGSLTNANATEGSAIKQTITANAGDVLTFSWNFLTNNDPPDPDFNDFAFFSLSNTSNTLGNTFDPMLVSFSRLALETGYQPYSYIIPVAGTYTLGFGVVDVGDNLVNSALLVDDVSVDSQAIPEPLTILGTMTAVGFGSWFRSRLRQK